MQKQTQPIVKRAAPRAIAGGSGMGIAILVNSLLSRYFGIELSPEEVTIVAGLIMSAFGMIVSRLGK